MSTLLKRVLLCAGLAAGVLVVGSGVASANPLDPGALIEQGQTATNDNATDQSSNASAETTQVNVNAPISILSFGSNNGDVTQSNTADTSADASNHNTTTQGVDQSQSASSEGGSPCDPCHGSGGDISQDQSGSNSNETTQEANAEASTTQVNVNAPISILSFGSNNGDVNQSNTADTSADASNRNSTEQGVVQDQWASSDGSGEHDGCGGCGDGGDISQSQSGSNDNSTDQTADATATTEQRNVNAPISILSFGSGGHDCGCQGSDGSDVDQSNTATTEAKSRNANATTQGVSQSQDASSSGGGCCDGANGNHGSYGKGHGKADPCGCDGKGRDGIVQTQDGSNANSTDQAADASASTEQENVNEPFTKLGSAGGDVDQANTATTTAKAGNANWTGQWIEQIQGASSGGGMS